MTTSRFLKGAMYGIDLAIAATEPAEYIYDGDDFTQLQMTAADGALGGYITSGQGTPTAAQIALTPGIALQIGTSGNADHDSIFMTRQTSVGAFDITINSGRFVAYETRFRINQGVEVGLFFGLCQPDDTPPTEDTLLANDTGILGDFDSVGFHALIHETDVDIDGVTRLKGGDTQTGADTMTEDEDALFNTYGFRFDGGNEIEWFLNNESFDKQIILAAEFPTGQALVPTWSVKTGETVAKNVKIDYWACVQALLSSDRPE